MKMGTPLTELRQRRLQRRLQQLAALGIAPAMTMTHRCVDTVAFLLVPSSEASSEPFPPFHHSGGSARAVQSAVQRSKQRAVSLHQQVDRLRPGRFQPSGLTGGAVDLALTISYCFSRLECPDRNTPEFVPPFTYYAYHGQVRMTQPESNVI